MAGGVLAEVGREVADAQLAARRGIVGEGELGGQMRPGVRRIEAAVLGQDLVRRLLRVVVHAEQQVRMRQRIVRFQSESATQQRHRLIEASEILLEQRHVAEGAPILD